MKEKRLRRSFYIRPALEVAKELLGKYIVRKIGRKKLAGKIIETEAYIGPYDKASHAYKGKITPRNKAEFLIGGHIYIYLVYGMYWQLNISTSAVDKPECVLIRVLEPIISSKFKNQILKIKNTPKENFRFPTGQANQNSKLLKLASGPGKLCNWLKLDKSFYAEDLTKSERIWLEDRGEKINPKDIKSGPRVGINYAGPYWSKRKWRFYL
jgi:DNA-3-methyladenine glycosylase